MRRPKSLKRGFMLITAIGVLAVLFLLVMAGANSVQYTYGFAHMRATTDRFADALQQSAEVLVSQGSLLEKLQGGAALEAARIGSEPRRLIRVQARLGAEQTQAAPSLQLVGKREGDIVVLLEATAGEEANRSKRSALYLINHRGNRRAPILLQETSK